MSREYTPEDIREIGASALPAVASSYDELKSRVNAAKDAAEATFGNRTLIPQAASEQFTTMWDRFVTIANETPESLDAMGATFVDIADSYYADEESVELDLEQALDGLDSHYENELNG